MSSYQQITPTYERFVLDPTNPTWQEDLLTWLQALFAEVRIVEDMERGGAATGFFTIVVSELYTYPVMAWGEDAWIILHNNLDSSITEVSADAFSTYYEATPTA